MIRVVSDSSSDVPAETAERLGIEIVPLTIRFGDDEFVDRLDLDAPGFWTRLRSSSRLPETAAPSAGAFLDCFRAAAAAGADGVVAICLSSALSATYQSAVIAGEQVRDEIAVRVVDSRTVTMSLGLQVIAAAEDARSGAGLDEVATAARERIGKTGLLAALDTVEFLRRGGRIGGAQAAIGSLLDIKPLITIEDGVVAAAGRVRTRGKAMVALADHLREHAAELGRVAVVHGGAEDLDRFLGLVRDAVPDLDPIVAELGPVVGTHSGPGTLGLCTLSR